MRLLRVAITGFGGQRERSIELGPGINLLLGPNEAGKSTILNCIAQVLMGKPSQRGSFADFTPWDGGAFAAALEMEHEGAHFRLERHFDESGARAVSLHRIEEDGTERLLTREMSEVRKWITTALGTGDDRLFYRVFCLTQADLQPLDNFSGLREHLEKVVSGAEVAVASGVQRIDARLAILRRGVGQPALKQNWGPLKRTSEERKEWEAKLHEATRRQRRLQDARREMTTLQQRIAEATARVELLTGMLDADRRRRNLQQRLTDLQASWDNAESERERIERLTADRDRLQQQLGQLSPFDGRSDEIRTRLSALEHNPGVPFWVGWMVLLVSLLLLIGVFALTRHPASLLFILGLAAGLYLVQRTQRIIRTCADFLQELHVRDFAEAHHHLEEAERVRRELEGMTLALQAVGEQQPATERRRTLAVEIAGIEEQLAQIPGDPLSAEDAHRFSVEQLDMQSALPEWRERERALIREMAVLEEAEQDLTDNEDGVAYWQQEEARAREEEQCLLLARELLAEAGEQTHRNFAIPLAERISPLFAAMTCGRYPQVRVEGDARSLTFQPLDATGTAISPDQLSRGAGDQFILAVRLALGLVIAGENGNPIFLLDDPLLHFDADRRAEAIAVLNAFSARAQVILATHDERLALDFPAATAIPLATPALPGRK